MKTEKCEIPAESLVYKFFPADYSDSFNVKVEQSIKATPDDLLVGFWTDMPAFVNVLFKIRNFLVRFVGLKGPEGRDTKDLENSIRNGVESGFMSVPVKDEHETVMLLQDTHLNAYLSVRISDDKRIVYANTLVKYNKCLGKIYFAIIRPFHSIVVKQTLKRAIKRAI